MKNEKIKKLVGNLLSNQLIMHISCTTNETPWICALEFVHDDECNLYWRSDQSSHHSTVLENNPESAIAVTQLMDSNQSIGIQTSGKSTQISDPPLITSLEHKLATKRSKTVSADIERIEDDRQWWMFAPEKLFYLNEKLLGYKRVSLNL